MCSSRMSGMKVAVGEGIARGPSVDLDGASLDAVQALGVGDQVLSFNQDLAVLADGDGAGAALEGEIPLRLDYELLGFLRLLGTWRRGGPNPPKHDTPLVR